MELLVKQKNSEVFRQLLLEKNIPFKKKEQSEALIIPYSNETKERIVSAVSLFIISNFFEKALEKVDEEGLFAFVEGEDMDESVKAMVVQEIVQLFFNTPYFFNVTVEMLNDYLERTNSIHIETFQRFNLRGFEHDVKRLIQESVNVISEKMFSEDALLMEVSFAMSQLAENIEAKGLPVNKIKAIRVRKNNENHVMELVNGETKENIEVSKDFIKNYLNEELLLIMRLENKEFENDFAPLVTILNVFPIEEIVIDKNISVEVVELLELVTSVSGLNGIDIRFEE